MVASRGVAVDLRELVERARRGDHDAFTELVGASIARLGAAARLILRDPDLARDAVQDAYLRAWRDLPGLRDPDRLDAWLHRLTVNACLDTIRRQRRRVIEVELTSMLPVSVTDDAVHIADRDQLERGFRRITVEQRAILVLHFYAGMPPSAVAETLGIPVGTARSRLHRAIQALRAAVAADERAPAAVGREGVV
jgi:RNA polymerase sigma-70 factor (ECF subfamily)